MARTPTLRYFGCVVTVHAQLRACIHYHYDRAVDALDERCVIKTVCTMVTGEGCIK